MLNELLKLWAEKDPDRCKWIAGIQEWRIFCWGSWNPFLMHPWCLPLLEYALREAILSRGWKWDLMNSDGIQAIIWTQQGDFHYNGTDYSDGSEEQPAIAFLMVYLQALGCEVEQ